MDIDTGGWIRFGGGPLHNCHLFYSEWPEHLAVPWVNEEGYSGVLMYKLYHIQISSSLDELVLDFYEYTYAHTPFVPGDLDFENPLPVRMAKPFIDRIYMVARNHRMYVRKAMFCKNCWCEHPLPEGY